MCIDKHHIAGKKHHDDVALTCLNCHRKLSDKQRDYPSIWLEEPKDDLVRLGFYLLGLSDLLSILIGTLRAYAEKLLASEPK